MIATTAEYQMSVKWAAIVEAAGMRVPGQSPHTLYRLGGLISSNPVVAQRRMNKVKALLFAGVPYEKHPPVPGISLQVLAEMTPQEKAVLHRDVKSRTLQNEPQKP